jgi:hypothetical protein
MFFFNYNIEFLNLFLLYLHNYLILNFSNFLIHQFKKYTQVQLLWFVRYLVF